MKSKMKRNRRIVAGLLLAIVLLIGTGVYLSDGYRADGGDHRGGRRGVGRAQYALNAGAAME